jgi:hypothetical protein
LYVTLNYQIIIETQNKLGHYRSIEAYSLALKKIRIYQDVALSMALQTQKAGERVNEKL